MTTINNSENLIEKVGGIERAREIVEDAPEGKSFISGKIMPAEGFDVKHGKYVMCDGFYKFHWCNGWDIHSYAWHDFVLNVIDLNDIRTAISEHDSREFKVGDLVVHPKFDNKKIYEIIKIKGDLFTVFYDRNSHSFRSDLRHATPSEIKAGHRLEAELHG